MEQKVKILIIALIAILVASFFLTYQAYNAKQAAEREADALKADNSSLAKKANDVLAQNQQMQNRISVLNADVERFTKEKESIQNKLELLNKEKTELVEQVKSLKSQKSEAATASSAVISYKQNLGEPADAYWAGILKQKTDLEIQIQAIRQDLKSLQIANEQIQKENNSLLLEVNSINREKMDMKRQQEFSQKEMDSKLAYNQTILDSLAAELVREKNDKFQIQENSKPVKDENTYLRRQLKGLYNRNISLQRKLAELQNKNATLDNRLYEMETMLKDKMLQADTLKKNLETKQAQGSPAAVTASKQESVELPPIVVRPKETGRTSTEKEAAPLVGRVLAINRDNNFIIMNLGEDSGIKVGNTFSVYRQDQPIADVEVIKIHKNISACDIKKEDLTIKVGDIVK